MRHTRWYRGPGLATVLLYGLFKLRGLDDPWFGGLAFNLVLAGVVIPSAMLATQGGRLRLVPAIVWLAMWPNALYLVTDLAHLRRGAAVIWLDVACYGAMAAVGLWVGAASLQAVVRTLSRRWGPAIAVGLGAGLSALGGAGVWLGRSGRHNSWDLIVDPSPVLRDLLGVVTDPHGHPQAWMFVVVYGVGLGLCTLLLEASYPSGPMQSCISAVSKERS